MELRSPALQADSLYLSHQGSLGVCVYIHYHTHKHIHTHIEREKMEYYSAIKRNEKVPFAATWMELENVTHSEVSQTEKYKYYMISVVCGIWKVKQINLHTIQKQTHRHRKQTYGYQRGEGERDKLEEYGINRYCC